MMLCVRTLPILLSRITAVNSYASTLYNTPVKATAGIHRAVAFFGLNLNSAGVRADKIEAQIFGNTIVSGRATRA